MADFSHHSLLLKMPPAFLPPMNHGLADASPTLPGFLLCSPAAHGHGAAAAAGAAMVEEASLGASSVVLDKKRKVREGSASISSAHSKDSKESKNRRGKKAMKEMEEEEEAHKGYIHVRARRGQATDSHSLAERLRRERISERMRMLQALVPGCDKVTGKALILDEIINYVQSLQNQVEFLSMRIASLSPVLYGFGLDSDAHNDHTQNIGAMSPEAMPSPVLNQASPAPSQAIMDTLQGQGGISFPQDNGGYLMQTVGDAKQEELINQVMFNYICSFQ